MAGTRETDGSSRPIKEHKQPQDRQQQQLQQQQQHPQVVMSSSSSSVAALLSEGQRNQLAAIRDLWRGTTMVMDGGAWTGEAREPQRKEQLLEQLKLARQLREALETAAHQAERVATTTEQVRAIIVQQTPIMNTLVSLTEAVRGNYTLWRDTPEEEEEEASNTAFPTTITSTAYHGEYNEWVEQDRRQRQQKLESAKAILRDQLQRMADPTRSWPKRTTMVLQTTKPPSSSSNNHSRDKSSKHPTTTGVALSSSKKQRSKQDMKDSEEQEDYDRKPAAKPKRSHLSSVEKRSRAERRDRKRDRSSSSRQDKGKKHKRHDDEDDNSDPDWRDGHDDERRPDMALSFATSPSAYAASRDSRKHRRDQRDDDSIRPDGVASNDMSYYPLKKQQHHQQPHQEHHKRPKTAPPKPAPISYKFKPMPGPKRCHNCKSYKSKFLKCQYMLPTGNKCGKYYCSECLEKDHGQLPAVTHQLLESTDWHCPACLGTCKCERCVRQRERDVRRDQFTQERQRSKRNVQPTNVFF